MAEKTAPSGLVILEESVQSGDRKIGNRVSRAVCGAEPQHRSFELFSLENCLLKSISKFPPLLGEENGSKGGQNLRRSTLSSPTRTTRLPFSSTYLTILTFHVFLSSTSPIMSLKILPESLSCPTGAAELSGGIHLLQVISPWPTGLLRDLE